MDSFKETKKEVIKSLLQRPGSQTFLLSEGILNTPRATLPGDVCGTARMQLLSPGASSALGLQVPGPGAYFMK